MDLINIDFEINNTSVSFRFDLNDMIGYVKDKPYQKILIKRENIC